MLNWLWFCSPICDWGVISPLTFEEESLSFVWMSYSKYLLPRGVTLALLFCDWPSLTRTIGCDILAFYGVNDSYCLGVKDPFMKQFYLKSPDVTSKGFKSGDALIPTSPGVDNLGVCSGTCWLIYLCTIYYIFPKLLLSSLLSGLDWFYSYIIAFMRFY
mgnify:FL=1|jgi:hypothetical protein